MVERVNRRLDRWMIAIIVAALGAAALLGDRVAPARVTAPYFLGLLIMLLSLNVALDELRGAAQSAWALLVCWLTIFGLMPTVAWLLVRLGLGDAPNLAVGLILLSSLPSATLGPVWTFLARGHTAFALTVTATTTLAAPFVSPLVLRTFGGGLVHVDTLKLLIGLSLMVLLPTLLGLVTRRLFEAPVLRVQAITGLTVKALIAFLVIVNVAPVFPHLRDAGAKLPPLVGLTVVQVFMGFALGFAGSVALRQRELRSAMTFSCGMRNTGLGLVLAQMYFHPLAVMPIVLTILTHHSVASLWQRVFVSQRRAPAE